MNFVALKDLCDFEKGSTGLAKAEPGDYVLVATGAERRTCNTYQFDTKAVCIPLVSSTGHGHASLNNVHYQEGKFALGSILVALTSKNENELDIQFLHLYLSQLKDEVLVPLMSGAANVALSVQKIKNIEVPLPCIDRQSKIVEQFKSIVNEETELKSELDYQKKLIKKLRQKILQDAFEGKLTTKWRAGNPDVGLASELSKNIAVEKTKFLEENKIKKQKILPPILDQEKPFKLPQDWEWFLLDEVTYMTRGASPRPIASYLTTESNGVNWVKIGDTKNVKKIIRSTRQKITPEGSIKSQYVEPGDFILSNSMSYGKPFIMGIDGYIHDGWFLIKILGGIDINYFYYLLLSNIVQDQFIGLANGAVVQNIRAEIVKKTKLPMPPILEQKAIVKKIEEMFELCDQLETQMRKSQFYTERLMQAVLKEAFRFSSQTVDSVSLSRKNIVPLKAKSVDYYKRTLLAAEIVHRLQKEPTLGHLKLQKLIYLCQKVEAMQLPTNFLQQAAGPYDPKMARSLDKQLKNKQWFEYRKDNFLKYKSLENAGLHKADYQKYFKNQLEGIDYIVELFRTAKSDQMEVVATLYACSEKIIEKKEPYTEALVIQRFYEWSEQKKKYTQSYVEKTLSWMKDKHVYPAIETS